jgi:hypothetical protein
MYSKVLLTYDGSVEGRRALREGSSSLSSAEPRFSCSLL